MGVSGIGPETEPTSATRRIFAQICRLVPDDLQAMHVMYRQVTVGRSNALPTESCAHRRVAPTLGWRWA